MGLGSELPVLNVRARQEAEQRHSETFTSGEVVKELIEKNV